MRSDEPRKADRLSVIIAVCYLITLATVIGLAFWVTRIMFIELGQQVRSMYPGYGL